MKKLILLIFFSAILSGCNTLKSIKSYSPLSKSTSSSSTKLGEHVGVLLVTSEEDCLLVDGCGPAYSLLASDMRMRTVELTGKVDESMRGQLIAVQGNLAKAGSVAEETLDVINVQKSLAITPDETQSFLDKEADTYVSEAYGCNLYWDRNYSWSLEGRQPYLIIAMRSSIGASAGHSIKLIFDGLTGEVERELKFPEYMDPCNP